MTWLYPLLLIALGIAVLLLGNRLTVLGAAVGALLGAGLIRILPGPTEFWVQLLIVGGLALLGMFAAGFARGIIDIVILVLGALAGAGIVLGVLDLFNVDSGILNWILALIGGVLGFMLIRRGRRGNRDWGMIVLASLIGALLVTRGLVLLIPSLQGGWVATLILVALAAAGFAFQGGYLSGRGNKKEVAATATTAKPAATVPPQPATPPAVPPIAPAGTSEVPLSSDIPPSNDKPQT